MVSGLLEEYTIIKGNVENILTGARMLVVSYGETFELLFEGEICNTDNQVKIMQFILKIDAPCWFGDKESWEQKVKAYENGSKAGESADCLLANELTRLRYWNLIQVEKVDFLDDSLAITFPEGNVLSIAYYAESDYAWLLEDVTLRNESERMMICCSGNELFQKCVPI